MAQTINEKATLRICGAKIQGEICEGTTVQIWTDNYIQCVSCASTWRLKI